MKYWIFVLCLISSVSNARIISWDATAIMIDGDNRHSGLMNFTFDTAASTLINWSAESDLVKTELTNLAVPVDVIIDENGPYGIPGPIFATFAFSFRFDGGMLNAAYVTTPPRGSDPFEYFNVEDAAQNELYVSGKLYELYLLPFRKTYIDTAASVPEPTTLAILGLGLAGLVRRRG